jgi:hypothetical protein
MHNLSVHTSSQAGPCLCVPRMIDCADYYMRSASNGNTGYRVYPFFRSLAEAST